MTRLSFRLLLLAFPKHLRDRIGRPLLQTLMTDSRAQGRWSLLRTIPAAWDVLVTGLSARFSGGSRTPGPRRGLRGVVEDLHQVRRSLARRKAYGITVVATLAIGIAVSAIIFAIITTVFVRDLPYRDPSRLAFMWSRLAWVGVPRAWVAGPHIDLLTRDSKTIDAIVPIRTSPATIQVDGRPEVIVAAFSHAPVFDVLGVAPQLGRGFVEADEPQNLAILSHDTWTRSFGARPDIVGASFELGSDRMDVIGVMPKDFHFVVHSSLGEPRAVDIWLPTRWPLATMSDGQFGFAALVRIAPEATLAQAQQELDILGKQIDETRFKSRGFGWDLTGIQEDLTRDAWAPMRLLGVAAALLLLVMAANIAGVMATRQHDRQREFAVRTALGAPRGSLARLILLESVGLWTAAAAIGLGVAALILPIIASSTTLPLPRLQEVRLDWMFVLSTMALAVLGGLIFGMVPALKASRGPVTAGINDIGRGNSGRQTFARSALVVAEVTVAVALVAGGAMLLRSYAAVRAIDPGFSAPAVLTAYLPIDTARYPDEAQAVTLFSQIIERVSALPGVHSVGGTTSPPLGGDTDQTPSVPAGWTAAPGAEPVLMSDIIRVTPGYFSAMGIGITEGRDFSWSDSRSAQSVVVVDERYAAQAWPGQTAIGRTVSMDAEDLPGSTVIGVVRHARQYRYDVDDRPQIFRPHSQDTTSSLTLAIRTAGDPVSQLPALRRIVSEADPRLPVSRVSTMSTVVESALLDRILQLVLVATFALSAIFLAAVGVYSVLSAMVNDRAREIGIRMALGADAGSVRMFVIARMAWLTGLGLVLGLGSALAASGVVQPLLFQVSPHDPKSLLWTAGLVLFAAAIATYLPVRRATRIDPASALKAD